MLKIRMKHQNRPVARIVTLACLRMVTWAFGLVGNVTIQNVTLASLSIKFLNVRSVARSFLMENFARIA